MSPTPRPAPPEPTASHRVEAALLRAALAATRPLPYAARVAAFGRIGRHVVGPLAGFRARALDNLAHAFPDRSPAWRRAVADACLDNAGRFLAETLDPAGLRRRLEGTPLGGDGADTLRAAVAEARPVVLLGSHWGNYQAPLHVMEREGMPMAGLYRPMRNPLVNRVYEEAIAQVSGPPFAQGRAGMAGFVRHLARGRPAFILFDLHVQGAEPIAFLGRPARTALTAAELALRYGAPLLPIWGTRAADGTGFACEVDAPIPPGAPRAMMEEATRRLEARIAADPGQWFWVHRRWKR